MADAYVNKDLLDYKEEENAEQVKDYVINIFPHTARLHLFVVKIVLI